MTDYERFRPKFEKAIDPRFFTLDHLDFMVVTGAAQVWYDGDSAIVTELKQYPTGVWVIEGLVAAGPLDGILGLIERAEQWGKEAGCRFARIESREGWGKVLKSKGWDVSQTALVKEL